ncbi:MAG: hypothetical protein ACRD2G_05660 [Terriglobia bacterium]
MAIMVRARTSVERTWIRFKSCWRSRLRCWTGESSLGIVGGKAGQQLGVVAVVLRLAAGDGRDLACVGHDHLMTEIFE